MPYSCDQLCSTQLGHDNIGEKQVEEILLEVENSKPTEVEMAHFLDCIETGAKPLTDPVGSLEGLQVIWKLYEAEERNEIAVLQGWISQKLQLIGGKVLYLRSHLRNFHGIPIYAG